MHYFFNTFHVVLSAGINTCCTRTTFNMEFLSFIRSVQPDYIINAVGRIVECSIGYLNEHIQVSYAILPDDIGALIGTDIVDIGRRVSFTRH